MMARLQVPRVGLLFQSLCGTEQNTHLWTAVLRETLGQEIVDVSFQNTELHGGSDLDSKAVRLDV